MSYVFAALGGALGALARWAVSSALPHARGAWPWATLLVNLTGCLVIGALLAVLLARFPHSPWLRPFLAVGVLGGYTTYSTFAVDVVQLTARRPRPAGRRLRARVGGRRRAGRRRRPARRAGGRPRGRVRGRRAARR